ncbi:TonB-dependent receptor [Aridibaculum aurantiacum]|uniref:TonB-dependent receptor n=1 Tax=Aridibaculum aurantiacum TaxID=2810307 RepID=UPI001A977B60|nr:TonB-dependent receptor [Aridibaculum aurantiacum]
MNVQASSSLKGLVLIIIFSLTLVIANAQNISTTGTVRDASGNTLSGATVFIEETKNTVVADSDGTFRLSLPAGTYTLVVSYVGQATQRVSVNISNNTTVLPAISLATVANANTVVVVGSRNPKRSAIETAVPVDVIPLAQITGQVGQLDLSQLLSFLAPSFNSVRQTLGDGTDHIDPAHLRGLGPDQVLVLVNGKRYHQSSLVNVNGTVNRGTVGTDLNSIPASSIERVEILRDGASAQYGSDAIAGVINIVLKKRTGLSLSTTYGQHISSYDKNYAYNRLNPNNQLPGKVNANDGENYQATLNYGFNLKKGYLNLSAEYLRRGATNRSGLYTGQIWPSVNGRDVSDSINAAKGLTRDDFDLRLGNSRIEGGGVVANFAYPINDNLEVYAYALANGKNGNAAGLYRYPNSIRVGGSFPSSNSSSAAAAAAVRALYPNGFLPEQNSRVRDYSASAGIRGKLGSWRFDASETFGANTYTYLVDNSVNYTQAYLPGITPQQLQTSFNSGKTRTWQSITNLDLSKNHDVLEGLNTAVGAEFKVDGYGIEAGEFNSYANLTTDRGLASIAGAQVFAGFLPESAGTWTRRSFALYSDNELDITKKWLVSAALRFENFSDFGSTLNYKVASRYKLADWLSLRGATSSGFRAPSLQQQHYSKVTTQFITINGQLVPVQAGTFTNDSKIAQILGIPQLKQETSISYSLGATSRLARGLELTVDAYQVDINNRIILSNAFDGGTDPALTAELNNAGANRASVFANGINTRSRGLEAVLSYAVKLGGKHNLNVTLAHSTVQNRVRRDENDKVIIHGSDVLINSGQLGRYFNRLDQSRIETQSPQNKQILSLQYRVGKFGTLLRFSRFGSTTFLADTTGGAALVVNGFTGQRETLDQRFSGKTLTDLSFTYDINKRFAINVGANNLFDVYPDVQEHFNSTSSGRFTYSRAVSQFGYNGRYVYGRLTFNL